MVFFGSERERRQVKRLLKSLMTIHERRLASKEFFLSD
jgi:hypothetical protein